MLCDLFSLSFRPTDLFIVFAEIPSIIERFQ